MRMILSIAAASLLLAACGDKTITKAPTDGSLVGMIHRDFEDATRLSWDKRSQRPIATTIWYPAAAGVKQTEISFPAEQPIFAGGWAARDAAPAEGGPYPLIVVSHGTGGSALQMMWFARRLAAKGFIVAAVDHHGNTAAEQKYDPRGFQMPWERARDISAMIDSLLADPQFGPRIDASRIGGAGYSLGGYTMAALAGGQTSLDLFQTFCAGKNRDATCDPQPEYPTAAKDFGVALKEDPSLGAALSRHAQSFADRRIQSFALFAPALAQMITDDSLLRISAPVLVIAGGADATAPPPTNAKRFADKIRTSRFKSFDNVGHYAFLDECAPRAIKWIPVCKDADGVDRAALHDETAALAADFFRGGFAAGGQ